ncbi:MAG: hypothetical protein ABIA75_04195 [Candidatus Neomarinimicrobiota bacterium]
MKISLLFCLFLTCYPAWGFDWWITDFIADSVTVSVPGDSNFAPSLIRIVEDHRDLPGRLLGIGSRKKLRYIPVDQYYILNQPLADLCDYHFKEVPIDSGYRLVIDNLTFWYDRNGIFTKGDKLNGYTKLIDGADVVVADWQWEYRQRKRRKQEPAELMGQLLTVWLADQRAVLEQPLTDAMIAPRPYRRQLTIWTDVIRLGDGYILDNRLALAFPDDETNRSSSGVRGLYYRKSALHESASLGGPDQQWYFRFRESWRLRIGISIRFGFNTINDKMFDNVDWWNIFMINTGAVTAVEYRPRYWRGVFAGAGIYQQLNLLPDLIDRYEFGTLLTIGINLP